MFNGRQCIINGIIYIYIYHIIYIAVHAELMGIIVQHIVWICMGYDWYMTHLTMMQLTLTYINYKLQLAEIFRVKIVQKSYFVLSAPESP